MTLVYKKGKIEIWASQEAWGTDYLVYGYYQNGDAKVCPSIGAAMEYAA